MTKRAPESDTDRPPAGSLSRKQVPDVEIISRIAMSNGVFDNLDLRNRQFKDLNANKSTFTNCNFSYSIFTRAYLHGSQFTNCTFTGCLFYDSNLRGASLYRCDLRYALFHRTVLDAKEVIASLPSEPNLRRESLQNLRANAVEIGDYASQRIYVLQEVAAATDHWSRALRGSDSYYRRKYSSVLNKIEAAARLTWLRLAGFVWGHGERPVRIVVSALMIIAALALVNAWAVLPRVEWADTNEGLSILRYCVDLFLDMSPDLRFRGFYLVDYVLITLRYVYVGLFISVLFKSISHR